MQVPYKSKAQEAYMHINHPRIAKKWDEEHNTPHNLPEHVSRPKLSSGFKKIEKGFAGHFR